MPEARPGFLPAPEMRTGPDTVGRHLGRCPPGKPRKRGKTKSGTAIILCKHGEPCINFEIYPCFNHEALYSCRCGMLLSIISCSVTLSLLIIAWAAAGLSAHHRTSWLMIGIWQWDRRFELIWFDFLFFNFLICVCFCFCFLNVFLYHSM